LELVEAGAQEMTVEEKREQVGETRHVIEPEIARTLPGTQGDALKAVQNLPGTARAPFGAGALIVRGGAPEDTRVFLDGQEIPQLYHFGGLTSVVATEALSSIDFLPGGFGVRYGRALSGVVDVETRGAHADRRSGIADVNVYNTELEAEGPVARPAVSTSGEEMASSDAPDRGRVLAAARRSYIDAVLPLVVPADVLAFTVAPVYYDYQLRYDSPALGRGVQGHVLLYGSDDAFVFVIKKPQGDTAQVRGRFLFHTLFHRLQIPVTVPLAGNWVVTATPGVGFQSVEIVAGSLADGRGERTDLTARVEARGPIGDGVKVLVGTDSQILQNHYVVHFPDIDNRNGAGIDPQREISASDRYPTDQLSAFAEATWTLPRGVTLVPGVRVD
ncbi:MAG TPA: TonB-dependent receptor plug domain-containing protein, partial [Dongiaceae bacterium]|nr:TonB-dependent receptor plug domain-containing protein [Dongiaceae bacterium]